jgi:1-acyl-sn-glycerol-3-phosphate acyltransferase
MRTLIKKIFYYLHYPLLLLIEKQTIKKDLFEKDNYIIAINHSSILDPVLITMFFYHNYGIWVRFLSAQKNYNNPIMSMYLHAFEAVKISENDKKSSIYLSKKLLEKKQNIAIFPEGRCVKKPTKEVKTGVIRLAVISKHKILPVHISGTQKTSSKRKIIPKVHSIRIILGKPINMSLKKSGYTVLKKESEKIMKNIYSLK